MGSVAQAADDRAHPGPERHGSDATAAAPRAAMRVQVPRALLRSADHSALAVLVWATYETLMPRALGGGRTAAYARRVWLASKYGAGERAIDDARRELVAETEGGPWLRRSRVQGAKRASRHAALRLPRETNEPYVDAPAWTMDLVHAGRGRPAGTLNPAAWRLYLRALDKARVPIEGGRSVTSKAAAGDATKPTGRPFETTTAEVGRTLMGGASASTARRRLAELETAGLIEVAERPGGSLTISVHAEQEAAEMAARRYAEHGRQVLAPRRDPFQLAPITPANKLQSPLPDDSIPQKAPPVEPDPEESPSAPAVGDHAQQVAPARASAGAGSSDRSAPPAERRRPRGGSPDAVRLMRQQMPRALMAQVPEHGIRRVLRALDDALVHRSGAEVAARITARWEGWRYRAEDIQDPTAVAIGLTRRGYDCPDVRCEQRTNIDTGKPCGWCDQELAAREPLSGPETTERAAPVTSGPDRRSQPLSGTLTASPVAEVLPPAPDGDPSSQGAALARRLLTVRSAAEREKIINDHRP